MFIWSGSITFPRPSSAAARHDIYLDTYIPLEVYKKSGICFRNHCRAEPARDSEPPGLGATVGGRDRAAASYAAADGVQTPASTARGRLRRIHRGRATPSLPAEARAASGVGCLAGALPPL